MPEFWMCLMQYIERGHSTNYWAVIETDVFRIQNTVKHLRGAFCKMNNAWVQKRNQKIFRTVEGEGEGGHNWGARSLW